MTCFSSLEVYVFIFWLFLQNYFFVHLLILAFTSIAEIVYEFWKVTENHLIIFVSWALIFRYNLLIFKLPRYGLVLPAPTNRIYKTPINVFTQITRLMKPKLIKTRNPSKIEILYLFNNDREFFLGPIPLIYSHTHTYCSLCEKGAGSVCVLTKFSLRYTKEP